MDFSVAEHPTTTDSGNQGWKKVTNLKKQRRQEAKDVKSKEKSNNVISVSNAKAADLDQSVFSVLNMESKERREKLAAKAAQANGGLHDLENSDDSDSDSHEGKANGVDSEEPKKKNKKPRRPKVSVAEAALKLDASNLTIFLSEISESFVGAHDVQLMRCADYFAQAFSNVSSEKFLWSKLTQELPFVKLCELPLCYIPEPIITITSDWITSQPSDELGNFILLLIKSILETVQPPSKRSIPTSATSNKAKVGSLIILAIVLRKRHDVLLQQEEALRTLPEFQGKNKLITIAWVYGQVALSDVVSGLWLWVRNLLPLSVGTQSSSFTRDIALNFAEGVIFNDLKQARKVLIANASRKGERLIPPVAFDCILHASFPSESARNKWSQRFQNIYPFIKEIALASSSNNKTSKPCALQLVSLSMNAASEDEESLSEEACSVFVWCISQNNDCYKIWEKNHLDHLNGSTKIFSYLVREWSTHSLQLLPYDKFKQTLKNLKRQNAEMKEKFSENHEKLKLIKKCDSACRALLSKTSSFPNCMKVTATLAAGMAMAYGFYLLSPQINPWNWDGLLLLSKTHPMI